MEEGKMIEAVDREVRLYNVIPRAKKQKQKKSF